MGWPAVQARIRTREEDFSARLRRGTALPLPRFWRVILPARWFACDSRACPVLRRPFIRPSPIATLAALAILSLVANSCGSAVTSTSPFATLESTGPSADSSLTPSQLQVDPAFSQAYARLGGPTWLGPAISQAFLDPDLGWKLQVFEFGVLAEDPSSETFFPLWVNNLLGRQTAPAVPSADPDCKYIGATGHNVCSAFLKFYEAEGATHLGPPVAEMGLDAAGILHQDFEYASLDIIGGSAQLAPVGRSFFAARGYSTSLLQPEPEAAAAPSQAAPREAETQTGPTPSNARIAASSTGNPIPQGPRLSPTGLAPLTFSNGFTVGPPFLPAYLKAGGSSWLGTPLSQPFQDPDLGWWIQVFDYGALAEEPGVDQVFLVQINTLLGREAPPSPPKVDPACSYFQGSGHNVCYQFLTYLQEQGVQRVGLPISELQEDPEGVLFQDFEYVRLEWLNGQVYREATGRLFLRERALGEGNGS